MFPVLVSTVLHTAWNLAVSLEITRGVRPTIQAASLISLVLLTLFLYKKAVMSEILPSKLDAV